MGDYRLTQTGVQVQSLLDKVQNASDVPEAGSSGLVTSGGIFAAIAAAVGGGGGGGLQSVTWAELVELRDGGELAAGGFYRITDYVTTTAQEGSVSREHPFDVVVMALDGSHLSELAVAARRSGDAYFDDAKVEAWRLWYCLDNDTDRFEWADEANGKGVIYRMVDEHNNDLPYDFKNIACERTGRDTWNIISFEDWLRGQRNDKKAADAVAAFTAALEGWPYFDSSEYGYVREVEASEIAGALDYIGVDYEEGERFAVVKDSENYGPVVVMRITGEKEAFYTFHGRDDGSDLSLTGACHDCKMAAQVSPDSGKTWIPNVVCFGICHGWTCGSGCYGWTCGYDCHSWTCGNGCSGWTCGNDSYDWTCGYGCYGWTCGSGCYGWTCGYDCHSWTCGNDSYSWTCGDNSHSWTCGSGCYGWTCGYDCHSWTCGNGCSGWTCGNDSYDWTCGYGCYGWTCGYDCHSWTCGNDSYSWTCGNDSYSWTCGDNSHSWTCGNGCDSWTCGYNSHRWTCGSGCDSWTCGDNSYSWTCGNNCYGWTCGSGCYGWTCGDNSYDWTCGDYFCYFIIDDGNKNFDLRCSQTTSSIHPCRNIHVGLGVNNGSTRKTITINDRDQNYMTVVKTSNDTTINA